MLGWLDSLPLWQVGVLALVQNIGLMITGSLVVQRLRRLNVFEVTAPRAASNQEWILASVTGVVNTAVTLSGFWLWQQGLVTFRSVPWWNDVLYAVGLTLFMDLIMFVGHYIGHFDRPFRFVHGLHHRFENPVVIDLFVMHPLESVGFGSLWLIAALLVDLSIAGILLFAAVNYLFGLAGHLGTEVLPDRVRRWIIFDFIATPAFHALHHRDPATNLGFYTVIWDRLLGSVNEDYRSGWMQRRR